MPIFTKKPKKTNFVEQITKGVLLFHLLWIIIFFNIFKNFIKLQFINYLFINMTNIIHIYIYIYIYFFFFFFFFFLHLNFINKIKIHKYKY